MSTQPSKDRLSVPKAKNPYLKHSKSEYTIEFAISFCLLVCTVCVECSGSQVQTWTCPQDVLSCTAGTPDSEQLRGDTLGITARTDMRHGAQGSIRPAAGTHIPLVVLAARPR